MLIFWSAAVRFPTAGTAVVVTAFAILMGLFAAFMLADEILQEYPAESDHRSIFITLIASLLVMLLLV
jgi:integral membrane sensor domain MASE1